MSNKEIKVKNEKDAIDTITDLYETQDESIKTLFNSIVLPCLTISQVVNVYNSLYQSIAEYIPNITDTSNTETSDKEENNEDSYTYTDDYPHEDKDEYDDDDEDFIGDIKIENMEPYDEKKEKAYRVQLVDDIIKDAGNKPDGIVRDADTVLADIMNQARTESYEITGLGTDILKDWQMSTDKESYERLFYNLTGVTFEDYIYRCHDTLYD